MSAAPKVSVVVPVHNGGQAFHRCLLSLERLQPPPEQILIASDGDTDGSWQLAEAFGSQVVRLPVQGGPARARNLGACQATGDILFFIDADVTVPPDAIAQVIECFDREPDLAALFGSYDDQPADRTFLSQYRNLLHHFVHQTAREEASTFWSGCGAIKRDIFIAVGGFNEGYTQPSIEDIELGYRLKKIGHRIRLCKSLQVKHWKRWSAGSLIKADVFQRALPWTKLIYRDRLLINDLNTGRSGRASVALSFGLFGFLAPAPWMPVFSAGAVIAACLLLMLNAPLYRFFLRERGLKFTAQAIPWHWLYFLYSGAAFAAGTLGHVTSRRSSVWTAIASFPPHPTHSPSRIQEDR